MVGGGRACLLFVSGSSQAEAAYAKACSPVSGRELEAKPGR